MDNLARNAMLARQAGMSYGKWKAMQPIAPIEKPDRETMRICVLCGKWFKPYDARQKYCDALCRNVQMQRNRKARQMAGEV